ncbi:MAG: hypothetical protein QOG64_880 [Acidimicrobiaceae bacterium]|nr:hypothetical protein [Acidimicrobiaceae bacterium]
MRRAVWPFLLSVAVVGVLFLFVFPARTYLAQRRDLAAAQSRVQVLGTQNKLLSDEASKLQDDAELERLARSQFGLVKPGEEAFAILPAPPPPTTVPRPAPAARRAARPGWATRFLRGLL